METRFGHDHTCCIAAGGRDWHSENVATQGETCANRLTREHGAVIEPGLIEGDDRVALTGGGAPPTIRAMIAMLHSRKRADDLRGIPAAFVIDWTPSGNDRDHSRLHAEQLDVRRGGVTWNNGARCRPCPESRS